MYLHTSNLWESTVVVIHDTDLSDLDTSSSSLAVSTVVTENTPSASIQDMNVLLLQEMKSLSPKKKSMKKALATTEKQLQASSSTNEQYDKGKGKKIKKTVLPVPQSQTSKDDSSIAELTLSSKKFIKEVPNIQK